MRLIRPLLAFFLLTLITTGTSFFASAIDDAATRNQSTTVQVITPQGKTTSTTVQTQVQPPATQQTPTGRYSTDSTKSDPARWPQSGQRTIPPSQPGVTTQSPGYIVGDGATRSERRALPSYTKIDVQGPFEVVVDAHREPKIEIVADRNLIPHIITEVQGDTLRIYSDTGFETDDTLKIDVHNRDIAAIAASDTANVWVKNLNNSQLDVFANDESRVNLSGKTTNLTATLNGHAMLKASHLQARNASVTQMGTSHAEVYARDTLDLNATDSSKLFYYGGPERVNRNLSGAAQLNPRP